MKAKRLKYPLSYPRVCRKLRIHAAERKQNCSCKTTFEGLRIPKRSSSTRKNSGYKPRSHQKVFYNDSFQKMTRMAQKKKISVSTVSKTFERWEERSETFQETPVKHSND